MSPANGWRDCQPIQRVCDATVNEHQPNPIDERLRTPVKGTSDRWTNHEDKQAGRLISTSPIRRRTGNQNDPALHIR